MNHLIRNTHDTLAIVNYMNFRVYDNDIKNFIIHEYKNGNLWIAISITDNIIVNCRLKKYISLGNIAKYELSHIDGLSKMSELQKFTIVNRIFNTLGKVWKVTISDDLINKYMIDINEPYLDRFEICSVYYWLEYFYNKSGVLQERKSNINRNMSTGFQLHRMGFRNPISFENFTDDMLNLFKHKLTEYNLLWID